MSESNIPETKKEKKSWAVYVLLGVTAAYFAVFYLLLIETKICGSDTGLAPVMCSRYAAFFSNATGDFQPSVECLRRGL